MLRQAFVLDSAFSSNPKTTISMSIDLNKFAINKNVDDKDFKSMVYDKRIQLIEIALGWKGATPKNHFVVHNVWQYPSVPSYKVSFGKYGKEYYDIENARYKGWPNHDIPDDARKNCNDMMPAVFKDGVIVDSFRARFDDIFALLEDCGHKGLGDVVRALSLLFFRNSLLLDHRIVDGDYRYCPPQELVDYICGNIPEYEGVPMEVYIHALDAIGFNEDVKYYTRGLLQRKKGIGRENNMKTYSYAAACVLGHEHWAGFVYKLMRGYGVAPITNRMFATYFPEAKIEYNEGGKRKGKAKSDVIVVTETIDHI